MKIYHLIGILGLSILSFACQDDEEPSTPNYCAPLEQGLITLDEVVVKDEINAICQGFPAAPTTDDPQGHEANLEAIIMKLNEDCTNFTTILGCYACLESYPPQSVINFKLDSAGVEVERVIRLLTPDDEVMTCLGVN